jgi:hypothetical protein
MKTNVRAFALAMSAMAVAMLFSPMSLSTAEARARLYVGPHYAAHAVYYAGSGLPWYAVRAYYFHGPWSGNGYSYNGWADYAARAGIACTPGTAVKGGDGIMYVCQ